MVRFVNFLLYQAGWCACVLGAAWHFPWVGMCIALSLIGTHVWLAADRAIQVRLALVAGGVGLVIDSIQLWAGVFTFHQTVVVEWLPPPWMTVLWMQFATTFRYSMRWLSGHYALSSFFGLVGAPIAFFAGERLGAIEFLSPRLMHYSILALLWSLVVPLLVYISDQMVRRAEIDSNYLWLKGGPCPETNHCNIKRPAVSVRQTL